MSASVKPGWKGRVWVGLAVLLLATVGIYGQVWNHAFINYDDGVYVYSNGRVRAGLTWENAVWAFRTFETGNWHPLTWLVFMAGVQAFGIDPGGHHAVNVMLHLINSALFFLLLRQATGADGRSLFAAGIFALHPLHVESVAWVAELKDVLSGLFWFLAMLAYQGLRGRGDSFRIAVVSVLLALGLLAKPMLVTLPLVLLLWDAWPLGRLRGAEAGSGGGASSWGPLVREKLPLLVLVGLSSLITLYAQHSGGSVASTESLPVPARLGNAALSLALYVRRLFWPSDLAVFYPHPMGGVPVLPALLAFVLIAALTGLVFRFRRLGWTVTGWLWFLIGLVPVIGIVQVGRQAMADRYMYLPLAGLAILLSWGGHRIFERWPEARAGRFPLAVLALLVFAFLTCRQVGYWKDSQTLFARTLEVTEGNFVAHTGLANALFSQGRYEEAIPHYEEALRIAPFYLDRIGESYFKASYTLGNRLLEQGRFEEAAARYRKALSLKPSDVETMNNLAIALVRQNRFDEALGLFQELLKRRPNDPNALFNRAMILEMTGRPAEAYEAYADALRADPRQDEARQAMERLARASGRSGR